MGNIVSGFDEKLGLFTKGEEDSTTLSSNSVEETDDG
jgi:hypothetical protein